jgi:hypothetical protein
MSKVEMLSPSVARKTGITSKVAGKLRTAQPFIRPIADIVCRGGLALLCGIAAMILFSRVLGIAWELSQMRAGAFSADVVLSARGVGLAVFGLVELSLLLGSLQKIQQDVLLIGDLRHHGTEARVLMLGPTEECIEAFRVQLQLAGEATSEIVRALSSESSAPVTFRKIRARLNRHARDGGPHGEVCLLAAQYLRALSYTQAEATFDRAVADGVCPASLIERLLGIAFDA